MTLQSAAGLTLLKGAHVRGKVLLLVDHQTFSRKDG
ncbi:MAG: hypothetical protein ACI9YG_001272, partial [Candidatus Azotimanducaceae bacterium]